MENLELTTEERKTQLRKEISHYGFSVINIYNWQELLVKVIGSLAMIVFIPIFVLIVMGSGKGGHSSGINREFLGWVMILCWILGSIGITVYLARIFGGFIVAGKLFYTEKGCIFGGKLYSIINPKTIREKLRKYYLLPLNDKDFPNSGFHIFYYCKESILEMINKKIPEKNHIIRRNILKVIYTILLLLSPIIAIFIGMAEISWIIKSGYANVMYIVLYIMLSIITGFIIATLLYRIFNPLYAFGNLGEKIQKLTPQIEEQSQKIQSEFQSDMNFSVLSDRFDSLSSTFSRIIALVLKLEKIEARANKGNLFDSEKYINSLRLDIIEPLQSLREFLENQKTKLLDSQKELTRVRVGGTESTGNIELQSKRSESLITELTENIEKLDAMIGKMGNK